MPIGKIVEADILKIEVENIFRDVLRGKTFFSGKNKFKLS
jgi:hypothetical protein